MAEFKENPNVEDKKKGFINFIIGVYVILIGVGLPLVFKNKYFDILTTKYYFYCICTISMLFIMFLYFVISWYKKKILISKSIIDIILSKLTWADCFVILFYVIALTSTITSDYVYESFWGNEGRFTGLFLMTGYVFSYFCISRLWKCNIRHIDLIVVSGILVSLFGITDYFNLDILKFKESIIDNQRDIFTSTIGNINTYTAYVGIIVAISTVLFSTAKELRKVIFYYICMLVSFFAIIMGVSDNAYLSLGALFAFLPLYLFKDSFGVKRYLAVLATFFSVIQVIGYINKYYSNNVIGIDSSFKLIINIKAFAIIAILLWIIVIVWTLIDFRKGEKNVTYSNKLRNIWNIMLVLIFSSVLYAIYDCNIAGNTGRYGSISSYLLFDDDWGTHRGFIWRNAMECYLNLSWWKKLVGFGPETFGILMLQKTANNAYNEVFDSAHNEYLHLLTTVGLLGMLSYIAFIIGVIARSVRIHTNKPYLMAVLFGVICYSVQAFVNLNLPIVTPVFWILLSIASAKSWE
jgi:hypothetical protein